ncbi:acetyl-CoA carboxylase biotin carboxyl carrier protein subunit [Seonamhaeicola sediminis]|uniref:Acetyl-CoA carboxylase biotin carboxyl carrier protein subunit n=1 Tax=Seonamhaeicola sediminis TaxID=2528206 RepID=A0A562YBP2_9FLAO|nr:acetyl-CoA carboxylase biotin carboxyl carrier protein subunit [Seonamhaeicola sediminis]TWO31912.1 acetyl-CoA carboxylase biotin carboxyl carrier protein subunit [Seonamhaeicola sediminis]
MNKIFKTKVNDTFDFEINTEDISKLDVVEISKSKFHILQNNKSFRATIVESDFNHKTYKVKINKNVYRVNIFNDLDLLIKEMGFAIGTSKHINSIKAPMPGLILEINITVGQEVKEDDSLLILEAMKMENVINSPRDGVIKSISVQKNDTVEKNQLLIEFE